MFCDIDLPDGVNGRDLADQARNEHPSLRVLYTSGSAGGDEGSGETPGDTPIVIPKPFTIANLATRMRAALDGPGEQLSPGAAAKG